MIKLKDELANSRVEILRENRFRQPMDIAEMHWNDYHKPILELIGFAHPNRAIDTDERPMDMDIEIIDIIGPERAKQLYPDLLGDAPKHKSTPIADPSNGYSQRRRATSYSNLDISGEFPMRERAVNAEKDVELRTAGLKTGLMLAEEKAQKFERKNQELESELKKVYQHLLKVNDEKKNLQRKCDTLEEQLDKVLAQSSSAGASTSVTPTPKRTYIEDIERYPVDRPPKQKGFVFTNSNRKRANLNNRSRQNIDDTGLYEYFQTRDELQTVDYY